MNKQQRGQGAAYSPSSSFPPPLSELRPCMNKCLSLPKPCAHLQSRICPLSLLSTSARVISLTGKLVLSPPASDPSGILHCLRISSHPPLQSHLPSLSAHLELYLRQNTSLQAPLHFHHCSTSPKCFAFRSSPGESYAFSKSPFPPHKPFLTSPGNAELVLLSASHMPAHDSCYRLYNTSAMSVYRCCFSPRRAEAILSTLSFLALSTEPGILRCQCRCC